MKNEQNAIISFMAELFSYIFYKNCCFFRWLLPRQDIQEIIRLARAAIILFFLGIAFILFSFLPLVWPEFPELLIILFIITISLFVILLTFGVFINSDLSIEKYKELEIKYKREKHPIITTVLLVILYFTFITFIYFCLFPLK